MKRIAQIFGLLLVIFVVSCAAGKKGKDKLFTGKITYELNYESDDLTADQKAQLPSEMILYVKEHKTKAEQVSAMYTMASIADMKDSSVIILFDVMGQKLAMKQTNEDMRESLKEMPEMDYTESGITKEILGHTCKKVDVSPAESEDVYTVYYTDEIQVPQNINWSQNFGGIEGLMLEYTMNQQGMTVTFTATEIEKMKISDSEFEIPDDYELKTPEEMKAMFGQ